MTKISPDFDDFSQDYKSMLDRAVKFSGDSSEYFSDYKARYVAKAMGSNFSGNILDFGCGVGLLSLQLKKHLPAAVIDGYDVSLKSIQRIPPELTQQGYFSNQVGRLHCAYQLVILSNVMHHVPKDQRQQTIAEIADHLVNGGRLILFEHNPWNPVTRWVVRQCPFDEDAILLRPSEVCSYFSRARLGFRQRDYIVFFPSILSRLRRFEPWFSWLPAGAQYAIVGEKYAG